MTDETQLPTVETWGERKGFIKPGWDRNHRYCSPLSPHYAHSPHIFNIALHLKGWTGAEQVAEHAFDEAVEEAEIAYAGKV